MNKQPSFIIDQTRPEDSLWISDREAIKTISLQVKPENILFQAYLFKRSSNGDLKKKYFLFTNDYVLVKIKSSSTKIRMILKHSGLRLCTEQDPQSKALCQKTGSSETVSLTGHSALFTRESQGTTFKDQQCASTVSVLANMSVKAYPFQGSPPEGDVTELNNSKTTQEIIEAEKLKILASANPLNESDHVPQESSTTNKFRISLFSNKRFTSLYCEDEEDYTRLAQILVKRCVSSYSFD